MNVLLVPTLALDLSLLDRLVGSIDVRIRSKVIINNGKAGALEDWGKSHSDWTIKDMDYNYGAAGSWNLAPQLFPDESGWLICNDDIWFNPGFLKSLFEKADPLLETHDVIRINETNPYYCFIWTRNNVLDYGLFDTNLWPAYYEDCDLNHRMTLAGAKIINLFQGPVVNHGKPRCGGMEYAHMLNGCGVFNRRYYATKWGFKTEFKTPYNQEGAPLSYIRFSGAWRRKIEPLWEIFITQPNPSIYD